jgi:hypothetical protein
MLSNRHHVEILIGQDIWRKIQEVHPTLAGCGAVLSTGKAVVSVAYIITPVLLLQTSRADFFSCP